MFHDLLAHLPTFPQGMRAYVDQPAQTVGLEKISNIRRSKMDGAHEVAQAGGLHRIVGIGIIELRDFSN
jgi:hypothetical protein